jgi:hypothetical protein
MARHLRLAHIGWGAGKQSVKLKLSTSHIMLVLRKLCVLVLREVRCDGRWSQENV